MGKRWKGREKCNFNKCAYYCGNTFGKRYFGYGNRVILEFAYS